MRSRHCDPPFDAALIEEMECWTLNVDFDSPEVDEIVFLLEILGKNRCVSARVDSEIEILEGTLSSNYFGKITRGDEL